MNSFQLEGLGAGGLGLFAIAYALFIFAIHVIMALAVNWDAKRLVSIRAGLFLFSPFLWGCVVLVFGMAGLAVYWAIHHSTLRAGAPPDARTQGTTPDDSGPYSRRH
ncbi:hypothetical protein [Luteolibacter sp. AS25]|uniref:hypothetical protein n=1 Tax=Luteolibacter sp. AS25 TaxID=3135776 RepID=UPI00398A61D8